MTLKKEDIEKLKILYRNLTGIELDNEQLKEKWYSLLNLCLTLIDAESNKCYDDRI